MKHNFHFGTALWWCLVQYVCKIIQNLNWVDRELRDVYLTSWNLKGLNHPVKRNKASAHLKQLKAGLVYQQEHRDEDNSDDFMLLSQPVIECHSVTHANAYLTGCLLPFFLIYDQLLGYDIAMSCPNEQVSYINTFYSYGYRTPTHGNVLMLSLSSIPTIISIHHHSIFYAYWVYGFGCTKVCTYLSVYDITC